MIVVAIKGEPIGGERLGGNLTIDYNGKITLWDSTGGEGMHFDWSDVKSIEIRKEKG